MTMSSFQLDPRLLIDLTGSPVARFVDVQMTYVGDKLVVRKPEFFDLDRRVHDRPWFLRAGKITTQMMLACLEATTLRECRPISARNAKFCELGLAIGREDFTLRCCSGATVLTPLRVARPNRAPARR
ncbi:hypothetical protein CK214_27985 [Mesorhizobium sp. WSM3882]|nr:hypothetical protein CK214_27985 [Mesorhizobium sp. WSM3882]